jgi:hypothetical protein
VASSNFCHHTANRRMKLLSSFLFCDFSPRTTWIEPKKMKDICVPYFIALCNFCVQKKYCLLVSVSWEDGGFPQPSLKIPFSSLQIQSWSEKCCLTALANIYNSSVPPSQESSPFLTDGLVFVTVSQSKALQVYISW